METAWSEERKLLSDVVIVGENDGVPRAGSKFSEVTNHVALWSGFVPKEKAVKIWQQLRVFHPRHVERPLFTYETDLVRMNLYGWMYRLEYVCTQGKVKEFLDDLKAICEPMFSRGQTTISEHLGYASSLCHGYTAYFAHLLINYVGGIHLPDKPGELINILPHPEILSWCQARVPWMDGYVSVWWSRVDDGVEVLASVPRGHKGKICFDGQTIEFEEKITKRISRISTS